jgi:hypothetical protein
MANLKYYNSGTEEWETLVIGKQGPTGPQGVPGNDGALSPNVIINGAFDIWQRGTSFASERYTADRWFATNLAGTWARETSIVPSGSQNSMKFTASASGATYLFQAIETANAIQFAGQTVTLSAEVASNVSLTSNIVLQFTTAVDTTMGESWTTLSPVSGGVITTSSTSFSRVSGTFSVPSTAKSLRVYIVTASMVSGNVVYYGEFQIEAGSVATPFRRNAPSIQAELAACQRYYIRYTTAGGSSRIASGISTSTTNAASFFPLPVTMRTSPSSIDFSSLAITNEVTYTNVVTALTLFTNAPQAIAVSATATGQTTNQAVHMVLQTNGFIGFSAEL